MIHFLEQMTYFLFIIYVYPQYKIKYWDIKRTIVRNNIIKLQSYLQIAVLGGVDSCSVSLIFTIFSGQAKKSTQKCL